MRQHTFAWPLEANLAQAMRGIELCEALIDRPVHDAVEQCDDVVGRHGAGIDNQPVTQCRDIGALDVGDRRSAERLAQVVVVLLAFVDRARQLREGVPFVPGLEQFAEGLAGFSRSTLLDDGVSPIVDRHFDFPSALDGVTQRQRRGIAKFQ